MKTTGLLLLATLCSVRVFSQDNLYTKNGDVIAGKVTEINQDQIKYKKASNPDGPTYVINKSDISLIEYKNGTKDVFTSDNNSNTNNTNIADNSNQNNNGGANPPVVNNNYYSNPNYSGGGSGLNVVIGASPFYGYRSFGYGGGWGRGYNYYYRPHRSYYYGGGYGGYHGYGHYGHHCH